MHSLKVLPGVTPMPHDFTPRDDAGRPIDYEKYQRIVEREYDAAEAEFRLERYQAPENPDLIALRVVDRSGRVRGFIGFEWDAMEMELPERLLTRVQRAAMAHPRPDLKLVG